MKQRGYWCVAACSVFFLTNICLPFAGTADPATDKFKPALRHLARNHDLGESLAVSSLACAITCRLITLSRGASVSCHHFPPCHRLSCAILQVEHATQLHQAALGSFGCWRAGFVWLLAMRRRGAPNAEDRLWMEWITAETVAGLPASLRCYTNYYSFSLPHAEIYIRSNCVRRSPCKPLLRRRFPHRPSGSRGHWPIHL